MSTIQKPCPVNKQRFQKLADGTFYCASCQLKVHDFTQKSREELEELSGQKVCGIFRADQLDSTPVFRWHKRLLFRALTVLSFLGFSVSPLQADEWIPNQGSSKAGIHQQAMDKKLIKPKKEKKEKKEKKKHKRRKRSRQLAGAYG